MFNGISHWLFCRKIHLFPMAFIFSSMPPKCFFIFSIKALSGLFLSTVPKEVAFSSPSLPLVLLYSLLVLVFTWAFFSFWYSYRILTMDMFDLLCNFFSSCFSFTPKSFRTLLIHPLFVLVLQLVLHHY